MEEEAMSLYFLKAKREMLQCPDISSCLQGWQKQLQEITDENEEAVKCMDQLLLNMTGHFKEDPALGKERINYINSNDSCPDNETEDVEERVWFCNNAFEYRNMPNINHLPNQSTIPHKVPDAKGIFASPTVTMGDILAGKPDMHGYFKMPPVPSQRSDYWEPIPSLKLAATGASGGKVPLSKDAANSIDHEIVQIGSRRQSLEGASLRDAIDTLSQPFEVPSDDKVLESNIIIEDVTGCTPSDVSMSSEVVTYVHNRGSDKFSSLEADTENISQNSDYKVTTTDRQYQAEFINDDGVAKIEADFYALQTIKDADLDRKAKKKNSLFQKKEANLAEKLCNGGIVNNTLRPPIPKRCDSESKALMQDCWSPDPVARPSFTEITSRLRTMNTALQSKQRYPAYR